MRLRRPSESRKIAVGEPYESASMTSGSTTTRFHGAGLHSVGASSAPPPNFAPLRCGNATLVLPKAARDAIQIRNDCAVEKPMRHLRRITQGYKFHRLTATGFVVRPHSAMLRFSRVRSPQRRDA